MSWEVAPGGSEWGLQRRTTGSLTTAVRKEFLDVSGWRPGIHFVKQETHREETLSSERPFVVLRLFFERKLGEGAWGRLGLAILNGLWCSGHSQDPMSPGQEVTLGRTLCHRVLRFYRFRIFLCSICSKDTCASGLINSVQGNLSKWVNCQ